MKYHIKITDNTTGEIAVEADSDCIMGAFHTDENNLYVIDYSDTDAAIARKTAKRTFNSALDAYMKIGSMICEN